MRSLASQVAPEPREAAPLAPGAAVVVVRRAARARRLGVLLGQVAVDRSGGDDPCYFVIRHAKRAQRFRNTQCSVQTDQSLHYAIAKLGLLSQENGRAFASDNSNRPARSRDGSRRDPQVEGFRPGELLISNCRKAAAVAGVLHTAPCQFRIKIVTAVHEPGSGLDPLTD